MPGVPGQLDAAPPRFSRRPAPQSEPPCFGAPPPCPLSEVSTCPRAEGLGTPLLPRGPAAAAARRAMAGRLPQSRTDAGAEKNRPGPVGPESVNCGQGRKSAAGLRNSKEDSRET